MLTKLSKTQRAVLICVVERHAGGWLPNGILQRCVPRSGYSAERLRLYGLLFVRRTRYPYGWRKSWKPTTLGWLVYQGLRVEAASGDTITRVIRDWDRAKKEGVVS